MIFRDYDLRFTKFQTAFTHLLGAPSREEENIVPGSFTDSAFASVFICFLAWYCLEFSQLPFDR